jgi:hypothetical protein
MQLRDFEGDLAGFEREKTRRNLRRNRGKNAENKQDEKNIKLFIRNLTQHSMF